MRTDDVQRATEFRSAPLGDAATRVSITLPPDVVVIIAERAAQLVVARLDSASGEAWIGVDDAAAHLACPKSRIYRLVSQRTIPHEKDGARLLFRRSDLDAWVEKGGAGR